MNTTERAAKPVNTGIGADHAIAETGAAMARIDRGVNIVIEAPRFTLVTEDQPS